MSEVNYFVLGRLFTLLECVELIHEVFMGAFDPDDEADVATLVDEIIAPAVCQSHEANRKMLARSIAYYTAAGEAPFQLMKDRCQELSLPDANSWSLFFHRIGVRLFGNDYREQYWDDNIVERCDECIGETILDATRRVI